MGKINRQQFRFKTKKNKRNFQNYISYLKSTRKRQESSDFKNVTQKKKKNLTKKSLNKTWNRISCLLTVKNIKIQSIKI